MAERADDIKNEIDRTKRELQEDLSQLKTEAGQLQRRVALGVGIAVGLLIVLRVVRGVRRRSRDSD